MDQFTNGAGPNELSESVYEVAFTLYWNVKSIKVNLYIPNY